MSQREQTDTQTARSRQETDSSSLLDEYDIEPDPRFVQARREAKIIFGYMASTIVFFVGISYWGAASFDGSYSYVMGMPPYFLVSLLGAFGFLIAGVFIGFRCIEDTSLEAWR